MYFKNTQFSSYVYGTITYIPVYIYTQTHHHSHKSQHYIEKKKKKNLEKKRDHKGYSFTKERTPKEINHNQSQRSILIKIIISR